MGDGSSVGYNPFVSGVLFFGGAVVLLGLLVVQGGPNENES